LEEEVAAATVLLVTLQEVVVQVMAEVMVVDFQVFLRIAGIHLVLLWL
jgi:hypothetical protein